MNIKKCDECKKILDNIPYYTIEGIQFTLPNSKFIRFHLEDRDSEYNEENTVKESWLEYSDLDFCEDCWKKLDFDKYLKKSKEKK